MIYPLLGGVFTESADDAAFFSVASSFDGKGTAPAKRGLS